MIFRTIIASLIIFGPTSSLACVPGDMGRPETRTEIDINGDSYPDFCRVIGVHGSAHLSCTLSTGPGLDQQYCGKTIETGVIDEGYNEGRSWASITGNGFLSFCRIIGNVNGQDGAVKCLLLEGPAQDPHFGTDIQSGVMDWGYPQGRAWVDVTGSGQASFCRVIGNKNFQDSAVRCTLIEGGPGSTKFGRDVYSNTIDWGYPDTRRWVDINGDGMADFCREVGDNDRFFKCLLTKKGGGFGDEVVLLKR
jgi:hypothetical protein